MLSLGLKQMKSHATHCVDCSLWWPPPLLLLLLPPLHGHVINQIHVDGNIHDYRLFLSRRKTDFSLCTSADCRNQ